MKLNPSNFSEETELRGSINKNGPLIFGSGHWMQEDSLPKEVIETFCYNGFYAITEVAELVRVSSAKKKSII
jgi:hypothetical protein